MTDPPVPDVCIVGAGPAGLALAVALIGTDLSVLVLEAGADVPDLNTLPRVELTGEDPYPNGDIDGSHAAMVGGTAGLWGFELKSEQDDRRIGLGCRYLPMQPLDLIARPEIGTPGWPIGRAELDRWSEHAHTLCGLGPYNYNTAMWSAPDAEPLPLADHGVVSSMFQFGSAEAFTVTAAARVEQAGSIELRRTCPVIRLELDPSGAVVGVLTAGPGGHELIRAGTVVLAAGGLETVRLLLETGRHTGHTPGNASGMVGRYFMEHPLVRGGLLVTDPAQQWVRRLGLYATRKVDGHYVSATFTLAEEVLQAEGLVACSALLVPRDTAYSSRGSQALARLRSPTGRREPVTSKLLNLLRVGLDAPNVARAMLAGRRQRSIDQADWAGANADQRYTVFEVVHQTEQSPDPDNRLTLAPQVDDLGRSRLRLHWRWSPDDRRRIARSRDLFATALQQHGVGTVINTDWDAGLPRLLGGTHHHLGATRMAADPAAGVVDADCRVHGTSNLYIASGSVFPSGGYVNPTLTVVALALRLADHLSHSN